MKFTEPQLDQIREIVRSELSNALKDIDATLKEINEKITDNEIEWNYKQPELTDKGKANLNEYRTMLLKKGR